MDWVLLVIWLVSYFLSKKAGLSDGKSALVASGVTAGAYYTGAASAIANKTSSWLGATSTTASAAPGSEGTLSTVAGSPSNAADGTLVGLGNNAITTTGKVLSSWGAAGTAGVVATTAAVSSSNNWLKYGAIAVGAYLLLKD